MHVGYDPRNETELKLDEHACRELLVDATFMGFRQVPAEELIANACSGRLS
jgi:hypothetical protein